MGQNISQHNTKGPLKWMLNESHKSFRKSSNIPTKHNTVKHKRPIEIFCKNFRYKKSSSSTTSANCVKTNINNNSKSSDCNQKDNYKKYSNIQYNNNSDSYSTFPFINGNRKNLFNYNNNNVDNTVNILNHLSSTNDSSSSNNVIVDEKFINVNDLEYYLNYCDVNNGNNGGGNYINNFNNNNCVMEKTYSDPYLYVGSTTSRQSRKCSRHRRRKCKDLSSQRFGYKIRNLDEFLTKVSYNFCLFLNN